MNKTVAFGILCCLCAALPLAAQTAAPEGMVSIPAGQFWMGRAHANNLDSLDLVPRAKMDDRPANHIYLDAFFHRISTKSRTRTMPNFSKPRGGPPWHWPEGKIPQGAERYPSTTSTGLKRAPIVSGRASVSPDRGGMGKSGSRWNGRNIYPWPKDAEGGPRARRRLSAVGRGPHQSVHWRRTVTVFTI